ncbi:MAG: hypothetical protein CMI54_00410 [Parcubacteria group bacterium]|nr:hypothetical protein [Parcubacteria group bacterium]|tara:strand:+ start:55 stop:495 length:441 start_codon:yes stop_codon:yes gene_type:complete
MEQNYTGLELSKKLAEAGCELESRYVRIDTRKSWKSYNCPFVNQNFEKLVFVPFWNMDEEDPECEFVENQKPYPNHGYNESNPLPAYDILNDLCVKYVKQMFGDFDGVIVPYIEHTTKILWLLQQGKKQAAEDYIWEHTIFNPDNV